MVDFATVIDGADGRGGLREEITLHVVDVTPQRYPEYTFTVREHTRRENEQAHKAREFSVDLVPGFEHTTYGHSTHQPQIIMAVKVWYPDGEDWLAAAISDHQAIWQALVDDTGYTDGVQMRIALRLEAGDKEETEEPPGFHLSTRILATLEVT